MMKFSLPNLCRKVLGLLVLVSLNSNAEVSQQQIEQAQQCTNIVGRLDRLNCFDNAFGVKLSEALTHKETRPLAWSRAMDAAALGASNISPVEDGEGDNSNAWIALKADNDNTDERDKPVLLMSCIDNLSRIELALPTSIEDARVRVAIANHPQQMWRSDDTGVLLSSARGIPAIDLMKSMSRQPFVIIRSNSAAIDGLLFHTDALGEHLPILRERCGW